MIVRKLLILNALLVALVSLSALISPTFFLEAYGFEITKYTVNLMRAFGAIIVGYAVINWLMRNEQASKARQSLLIGAGVSYVTFAIVNIINNITLPGANAIIGWVYFGLNTILGVAFLVLGFREPIEK
ncbi:MAG: hypothetical protein ISR58_21345 [Anaerolineales bacterium]|nr:hypothetical protein [Chloroflexota bacterium]MBL6983736.1 hypothetical protein [Anaerolineales bacterium]